MIREIQIKDKEQWEKLYRGYADFYKVEINNKILQTVWNWLHDKNHEVKGLVFEVDGNIVGLAHYRRMPSPLRGQDIGFLDDLFVDPKYRGKKIGEKMLNELKKISSSYFNSYTSQFVFSETLSYKDLALILSFRVIHLTKFHPLDFDITFILLINFSPIF